MEHSDNFPYLHGFSKEEQDRLRRQARFGEHEVYRNVDFSDCKNLLEVGCGVGAQSEILLRRFPDIHLTGIDLNKAQLDSANAHLNEQAHLQGRYVLKEMNAADMEFESHSFDGAFLCWILEHVPDPKQVLSEVRRVLKPGAKVYVTEVMNSSFFLDPYSPNVWKYWMAFNDYQYDKAGDPFIGAKLGNLMSAVGFSRVQTEIKSWLLDNRHPERRKATFQYWMELLFSAEEPLLRENYVEKDIVEKAKKELMKVQKDPNAVFLYSFMQASARVINVT